MPFVNFDQWFLSCNFVFKTWQIQGGLRRHLDQSLKVTNGLRPDSGLSDRFFQSYSGVYVDLLDVPASPQHKLWSGLQGVSQMVTKLSSAKSGKTILKLGRSLSFTNLQQVSKLIKCSFKYSGISLQIIYQGLLNIYMAVASFYVVVDESYLSIVRSRTFENEPD